MTPFEGETVNPAIARLKIRVKDIALRVLAADDARSTLDEEISKLDPEEQELALQMVALVSGAYKMNKESTMDKRRAMIQNVVLVVGVLFVVVPFIASLWMDLERVLVTFGLGALALAVAVTIMVRDLTPAANAALRIYISIAAGAAVIPIPGTIGFDGWGVKAAGAVVFSAVVYFLQPAVLGGSINDDT